MKISILKKWKWLGINMMGEPTFFTQRPIAIGDEDQASWCLSFEAYEQGAEEESGYGELMDLPRSLGLYERNGDEWELE